MRSSWTSRISGWPRCGRISGVRHSKEAVWSSWQELRSKELQAEVHQAKTEKRSFEVQLHGQRSKAVGDLRCGMSCQVLGWEQTSESFLQENSKPLGAGFMLRLAVLREAHSAVKSVAFSYNRSM